jgi:hypothetical protein
MKKELSPEELEWVYNNIETVRAVMKGQSTPDDFSKNVPDPSPLAVVKAHLQGNLKKKLQKIEKSRADFQENMVRFKRYLNEGTPELKVYAEERIAELASDDFELNAASHIEVLQLKLELLDVDPAQVFLPIGTIVRIIGVPEYRDVTRLSDDRNNYPVVGSIGVVVSLHGSNDMPIGVAFRDEYKDGWGTTNYPDYDRVPTYRVEREMLEVVGYSLLPDGTEYKGYGYEQTHYRNEKFGRDDKFEMILEGAGYFWRLHDFGGTQGIELLQAQDSMEEYSWIEGPIEKYRGGASVPGM